MTPRVTVILPVRNEVATAGRAIASILSQDWPPGRLEILVVDGLSTDGTAEAARRAGPRVRVLCNPRRTAAAGLNLGLREASGDVIVRLDGHAEAGPGFLREAVAALDATGADCVGGPIETIGEGASGRAIAAAMSSRFGAGGAEFRMTPGRPREVDTVAFGAYRRAAFGRAGVFDPGFVRDQDDEFHLRLRLAGGRIVLVPQIRSTYRCRGTLRALARQYFGYGLWKPRVLRKHGRLPSLRGLAPPALVAGLAASVAVAAGLRDPRWLAAVAAPYAAANLVASGLVAARRGIGLLPRLPLACATMHLAYGAGFLKGLVLPPGPDEPTRIRQAFERRDAAPRSPERDAPLLAARRAAVRDLLGAAGLLPGPAARILDAGCGRGDSLADLDGMRFGIDLLPTRAAAARGRHPGARVAVADAACLPFSAGSFDLCLLFTVMSSILDEDLRRRVAAEVLRVLRSSGAVVVYDFAFQPWDADVRGLRRRSLARLFPGCRVETRRVRGPVPGLPTHFVALVRRDAAA